MTGQYNQNTDSTQVVEDLKDHIKGKVILTTGVSPGGLGAHFVELVATAEPKLLVLAGRTRSKVEETAKKIAAIAPKVETRVLSLDVTSLASVREAAKIINLYPEPIDVLVQNAGIMGTEYFQTPDGLEGQLATNYVGPWLLTNLIMDKILSSEHGGRVVNVSSAAFILSPFRFGDYNFHDGASYDKWRAYGSSKTALLLNSIALAQKLGKRGLVAVSVDPGVIQTNLPGHMKDPGADFALMFERFRDVGMAVGWRSDFEYKTPSQGIATHVYGAFEPSMRDFNGRYLTDAHVPPLEEVVCWGRDSIDAQRLWKLTEEIVGQKFDF